jgi:hypothetical protein
MERPEYDALRAGLCAICSREGDLDQDHDHGTGERRGFLCANCNRALGLFKDNPEWLRRAARYLEAFDAS